MEVSAKEKELFIRWILGKYEMKRRECVWILNYFLNHKSMLDHLHFVEQAHFCPKAVIMSTTKTSGIPFRFYKGSIMTADAEKSFMDIRVNPEEPLYIEINFPKTPPSIEYLAVLEENPDVPHHMQVQDADKEVARSMMDESVRQFQLKSIQQQIDDALDTNDQARFVELAGNLKLLAAPGDAKT